MLESNRTTLPRWLPVVEVALIGLVFFVAAGWPPPEMNEPHYLGKARHFWDPNWIRGDFFLNSHDTHLIFYVTLGWLAKLMSLPTVAWCGRILTWGLLAWAWRRLSWALLPRAGWAVLSAAWFVLLSERFHMAGEWVVGGFEAKGLAYALVFFALGDIVRDRWTRAWILLGIVSMFHVVVGGWAVIAAGIAWLLTRDGRPRFASMLPGLAVGGLLALPGVLPALALGRGVPNDVVAQANQIYVFERLPHHLWPMGFPLWFVERYLLMFLVWVALCVFVPPQRARARLRGVVIGSLVISFAGLLISLLLLNHPATAANLLRFYWFRLGDALLPVGVAMQGAVFTRQLLTARPRAGRLLLAAGLLAAAWQLVPLAAERFNPDVPRADGPGKVIDHADWVAACEWIRDHTPVDACFLTPRAAQTFKWYAQRAEVVTWKDIPQKPDELVEWWRRMHEVNGTGQPPPARRFYTSLADEGAPRLQALGRKYGARYVLTSSEPPLDLPRLYANDSYAVYELSPEP